MKARVKSTGEIVEVTPVWEIDTTTEKKSATSVKGDDGRIYDLSEVDIEVVRNEDSTDQNPDYWTRLEHQAAIAAMQGMVSNSEMFIELGNRRELSVENAIAEASHKIAHALVEKYKKEEK